MIGRVTELMTTQQVLADIQSAQDQMDTTQQQLASGLTISQPSDDPYGASLAVTLNDQLSSLTGYTNDITDGTGWSQATSASLTNIQNMVQRVQELVVQAANGTESATDLADSAAEVNQLTSAIEQEANTQYNGQYIFSGTATSTAPYAAATGDVYQGNGAAVSRQIGPGTSLQVNVDLSTLLGNGQASGDGGLLDTLRTVAADLNGGTPADVQDLSTKQISNLQGNFNTLEQMQAGAGATQDRLTLATSRISALQTSDTAALSNDEDTNMATAMTTYSNEQAAFSAALRAGADIVQNSLMNFLSTP
jgi:flagellar hook-associated protein 3 FlgL